MKFNKLNNRVKAVLIAFFSIAINCLNLYSANIYEMPASIQYNINTTSQISGNYILLKVFIQSTGDDFSLGMSSIGIGFDTSVLKFDTFLEESTILFSNNSEKGYKKIECNPQDSNKINNYKMIEVKFDTTSKPKPSGIIVPKTNTYLGTLKFQILKKFSIFKFNWHSSTTLRTINNANITALCEKKDIDDFILYKANIIAPVGGESFYPGKKYDIKWNSTGNYPIYIQYSNDGASWANVDGKTVMSSKATYSWTIPTENSSNCYLRLQDSASKFILSQSAPFSIFEGFAQLVRPASGDALYIAGKTDYIKWIAQGFGKFKFEVSTDGGDTWKLVAGPVESSLSQTAWKVPNVTTKAAMMRIIEYESGRVLTTSGKFKIILGTVTFKNPVTNELVNYNRTYRIRWTANGITTFDMDFSTDNGKNWISLAATVNAALGYYDWNVPQIDSKSTIIRAIWNGDPEMEFGKSGTFTIKNPVGVEEESDFFSTLISPNPASDYIFINHGDSFSDIEIYNYFGEKQKIYLDNSQISNDRIIINISSLPNGIYFIKFGEHFTKFLKM